MLDRVWKGMSMAAKNWAKLAANGGELAHVRCVPFPS
jgi:hypothetical protein